MQQIMNTLGNSLHPATPIGYKPPHMMNMMMKWHDMMMKWHDKGLIMMLRAGW